MRGLSILFLLILVFSGCKSPEKLVLKAHSKNALETAETCNFLYYKADSVIKETKYIKGDTIYLKQDTFKVDCSKEENKNKIIDCECPPSKLIVDTFYSETKITEIDRKLEIENNVIKEQLKEVTYDNERNIKKLIRYQISFYVLLFLYLMAIYKKFKNGSLFLNIKNFFKK